ncbi:hypothetical protein [Streptomyces phaeochromogenes]|uniref:hypothetical protein n=1 Tax=Streptomyces phaeochromogenes TaxID=1923 RepID=UPI000AA02E4C|nr:hypothetical protein [Streptomyces phaeochromogenes]
MARSTIQDKFSGKSPLNLSQILSLIEALAEHARISGIPLPAHEIEQSRWREFITADKNPTTSPMPNTQTTPWNLEPLRQAQMFDLVEIVENSHGTPTSSWLPRIIAPMLKAQMDISEFIRTAGKESPQEVLQTLRVLDSKFPQVHETSEFGRRVRPTKNDRTVGELLWIAAIYHGAEATPAIVVGLRLAEMGEHTWDFLGDVASTQAPIYMRKAIEGLRTARLSADADTLLSLAGSRRKPHRVLEVITYLNRLKELQSRDKVLKGVCALDCTHLEGVVERLREHFGDRFTDTILQGIPRARITDDVEIIRRRGSHDLAQRLLARTEEPTP